MLSVYGDESMDGTGATVFAVAGIVGKEADWQDAEIAWTARTGGDVFHAADCEGRGDLALYKDLTQIIVRSRLAGYGVAADLEAHGELFPGTLPGMGYYHCFQRVVWWLTEKVAMKLGLPIEFTFDQRRESKHNAGQLYGLMRDRDEWTARGLMGHVVSFASRENPRIQMADLIARETMKSMHNEIGPVRREPRKSMLALTGEGHVVIEWFDRSYWESVKSNLQALADKVAPEYEAWLRAGRRHDNWANRFVYMATEGAGGINRPTPPVAPPRSKSGS